MKSVSASCGSVAEKRSVAHLAATKAGTRERGSTRYATRSAGKSVFENVPT
jgi:hypothetical protein